MKLYEFEGKALLQESGIRVPKGSVVTTVDEAKEAASILGYPVVIKGQLLRGGRGKAGLIRSVADEETLSRVTADLLSMEVDGEKIDQLLIEERIGEAREFYAGITLDPKELQPLLMVSTEGGMDIEEVAEQYPDKLFTRLLHPLELPSLSQLTDWLLGTGLRAEERVQTADTLLRLVQAYFRFEAITLEINPLMISEGQGVFAADVKLEIDDSALGRVKEVERFLRSVGLDALEAEARSHDMTYVRMLQGNIGLISNGAGLGMATMDMISLHGGRPANFLDMGGNPTEEKMAEGLRIVLKTPGVQGVLMNAFGGIGNCERMAKGIVSVIDELHPDQTIVVKMRGHSQEEGWALVESRQIPLVKFGTTEEAVILLLQKMEERGTG
jgi:succinyl-CoA synthetase beta subunit